VHKISEFSALAVWSLVQCNHNTNTNYPVPLNESCVTNYIGCAWY